MSNKVFTVPQVAGSKRTSARDYTHAIIGQFDFDAELRKIENQKTDYRKHGIENYNYHVEVSKRKHGDPINYHSFIAYEKQENIDNSVKWLKEMGESAEEFAEKCHINRIDESNKRRKKEDGEWVVLQWSMSEKNALKAVNSFAWGYKNLKVVPTQKIKG